MFIRINKQLFLWIFIVFILIFGAAYPVVSTQAAAISKVDDAAADTPIRFGVLQEAQRVSSAGNYYRGGACR